MTLDEIATYTCAKLGISDAAAKAQAILFTKARWRLLWNEQNWRQTRCQATVDVAAGTQDVTLPEEFEFATAARWAGQNELLAMDDVSALATNPAGYDQTGPVLAFVPMGKNTSGATVIRLMQTPRVPATLLVIGKRKCVELAELTDSPMIPGASEVLCEFVMADLYEWLRQFGKAQAFQPRAAILIGKMMDIEMAQTSEVRRIVPNVQVLDDGY